jgi:O-antigen/teichoic acid export membrane protein
MIYGLSYSLGRIINFLLVTVYLTRVFENEREYFSIYNEIYFFIALFLGILTLRMETTFFRFTSDEAYHKKIYPLASQLILITSLIFIVAIYIFIKPIEGFLQYPQLKNAILYSAWIIVFDVLCSLPFAKLRYKKQAIRYAWIKMSGLVLNIILVLVLLNYSEGNAGEKLTLVILSNLVASGFVFIVLFKEVRESFAKADWSLAKKILQYGFPLILVTACFIIIQFGGTSILKYFLPGSIMENLDQSSQYNAAVRLAVIMNLFVTAFNYAAEPFFFREVHQEKSREVFAKVSLYFILSCCVIYLATCLFVDVAALLLAKNFREELYLVKILLLANIFMGLYSNISSWYKLSDRNYLMAVISISGLVIMIVLNIFLIPVLGNSAAAYANLCSYFFICMIAYFQGQKYFPIPYPIFKMSLYLSACIALVWIFPLIYQELSLGFITEHVISFFIVIGFCFWVYFAEVKKEIH